MKLSDLGLSANAFAFGVDLNESATSLVDTFTSFAKDMIKANKVKAKGTDAKLDAYVEKFKKDYEEPMAILAAVLIVYSKIYNEADKDLVAMMGDGIKTLAIGNTEESFAALKVIDTSFTKSKSQLARLYRTEVNNRRNFLKNSYIGTTKGDYTKFIETVREMIRYPALHAQTFDKQYDKSPLYKSLEESLALPILSSIERIRTARDNIIDVLESFADSGYLNSLTTLREAVEKSDSDYFMFITLSVFTKDSPVASKIAHKHYKVTIGTTAANVKKARTQIKRQVTKSLVELNSILKKDGVTVTVKDTKQFDTGRIFESIETVLEKNIEALTTVPKISTGVWFLDGIEKHGNIGGMTHAVWGSASLNKTAIKRTLNKQLKESIETIEEEEDEYEEKLVLSKTPLIDKELKESILDIIKQLVGDGKKVDDGQVVTLADLVQGANNRIGSCMRKSERSNAGAAYATALEEITKLLSMTTSKVAKLYNDVTMMVDTVDNTNHSDNLEKLDY